MFRPARRAGPPRGSAAADEGDDFDGVAVFEGVGFVLFVWDELLVDFGCACGGCQVEALDEGPDGGVFGEFHGLGVDDNLHVKLYVPNPRKFGRLLAGARRR